MVGSIERLPWMGATLPRHGPTVVEVASEFYRKLNNQAKLKQFGCKSGSRIYVSQVLCVRNNMRFAGLGSKIFNEAIRYSKEKGCKFFDFVSLDGTVSKVILNHNPLW